MAMEQVPYLVGGGFEHSEKIMRAALAAATSGAEGIMNAGEFKVKPTSVPGSNVAIAPGNALLRNTHEVGQTYACRANEETEIPIQATGSSGARTDLIVARIDDPMYGVGEGSFDPETWEAAKFEVIQGVPASTKTAAQLNLSYPAIALARITLPKSTGTVTAGMITDLRQVALPRTQRHLFTHNLYNEETDDIGGPSGDPMGEAWPNVFWNFSIPSWAARVRVRAILGGVRVEEKSPNNFGQLFVRFGTVPNGFSTQAGRWDISTAAGGVTRQTFMVADDRTVPTSFRGTDSRAYIRATRTNSNSNTPRLDTFSSISLDLEFYETAV